MLTTAPGPDVAPYHGRQIVVLTDAQWEGWLAPAGQVEDLLRPLPAGSLDVAAAYQSECGGAGAVYIEVTNLSGRRQEILDDRS